MSDLARAAAAAHLTAMTKKEQPTQSIADLFELPDDGRVSAQPASDRTSFLLQQIARRRVQWPRSTPQPARALDALRVHAPVCVESSESTAASADADGEDAAAEALVAPAARFGAEAIADAEEQRPASRALASQPQLPASAMAMPEGEYAEFLDLASAWRKRNRKRLRNQSADAAAAADAVAAKAARRDACAIADALTSQLVLCAAHKNKHRARTILRRMRTRPAKTPPLPSDALLQIFHACIEADADVSIAAPVLRAVRRSPPLSSNGAVGAGLEPAELMVPAACLADSELEGETVTMLCEAVRFQRHALAELLLARGGADPDFAMAEGCTCAVVAAFRDDARMLQLLHAHGADLDAPMTNGATALCVASFRGSAAAAAWLARSGAAELDAQADDGTTPLIAAVQTGRVGIAHALLDCGADVNLCKRNGSSAVIVAVRHARSDMIPRLVARGADPDLVLSNGATALVLACANGDTRAVATLLDLGADASKQLASGANALAYACHRGNLEAVVRIMARAPVLTEADMHRLRNIARAKKRGAVETWLDLWAARAGLLGALHFACALGDAPAAARMLSLHGEFSAADREALPAVAAPGAAAALVGRALKPFARDCADAWPRRFRRTARAVLDMTCKGAERDVLLLVLSFCGRDWFSGGDEDEEDIPLTLTF